MASIKKSSRGANAPSTRFEDKDGVESEKNKIKYRQPLAHIDNTATAVVVSVVDEPKGKILKPITESENKENTISKNLQKTEKTKSFEKNSEFSNDDGDKENLTNKPQKSRISLEETRKRALQPLNDAGIKIPRIQKKSARKVVKRSEIKSDSELYSLENTKNRKLKTNAKPAKEPSAEPRALGGSQRVEVNYADIVAANNKKYSQKFELHKENLPSSKSSMDAQLKALKSKHFPFRYLFKPQAGADSASAGLDTGKTEFEIDGFELVLAHLSGVEGESIPPKSFMAKQVDINEEMRRILLNWLSDVRISYKLGDECFFLAVALIDRFLSRRKLDRSKFQLLGCAAMFTAGKFTEVSPAVANDFVMVSKSCFELDDLYQMELAILESVNWQLPIPPHFTFANHYLALCRAGPKTRHMCHFVLELSLFDTGFSSEKPSLVVSAALFFALHCEKETKDILIIWKKEMRKATGYTVSKLKRVVGWIKAVLERESGCDKSVMKKYGSIEFSEVANSGVEMAKRVHL